MSAADNDTPPGQLTYAWSIAPTVGSLDDATSDIVVYSIAPGGIAVGTTVTITVTVSDGYSSKTENLELTVVEPEVNEPTPAPELLPPPTEGGQPGAEDGGEVVENPDEDNTVETSGL